MASDTIECQSRIGSKGSSIVFADEEVEGDLCQISFDGVVGNDIQRELV